MNKVWWIILGLAALVIGGKMSTIKIINQVALLPKGKGSYRKRNLSVINGIVVHHSAAENANTINIANYHITRGWPGIGYHFVIAYAGEIYQTNELDTISYHVGGSLNTTKIGICLIGNLSNHPPTTEQMESLRQLIKHLKDVLAKNLMVKGHRDYAATECPGKMMDLKLL